MQKTDADLHHLSATELVLGLQRGQWQSQDLVRHFLERIHRLNPQLAALHTLNKHCLDQAKALDQRRAQGEDLGLLAGLPFSVKDAFPVKGLRSTYGMWPSAYYIPHRDCRVIAALRAEGALFLGRSAVPTACFDWNCRNQLFPECVHPQFPERTPGGSSGGAACALVSEMTPLEIGSDLAGSIRYPAHCCGIYGMRTSDGWLTMADAGPNGLSTFTNLVVCGPLARHLEDLLLMLQALARHFPDSRLRSPKTAQDKPAPQRLAYSRSLAGLEPDADTLRVLEAWLNARRAQGIQVEEVHPDLDFDLLNHHWGLIVGYEMRKTLPEWLPGKAWKKWSIDWFMVQRLGPGFMRQGLMRGLSLSHAEYLNALAEYRSTQNQIDAFFRQFDAWVLPVSPSPALLLSEFGTILEREHHRLPYADFLGTYLCSTSLTGTPALTVPAGESAEGLPIGLQIHGPRFGDLELVSRVQNWLADSPSPEFSPPEHESEP